VALDGWNTVLGWRRESRGHLVAASARDDAGVVSGCSGGAQTTVRGDVRTIVGRWSEIYFLKWRRSWISGRWNWLGKNRSLLAVWMRVREVQCHWSNAVRRICKHGWLGSNVSAKFLPL
jgi:hypothetical protein